MYEIILAIAKKRGVTIADISRATNITENIFSNLKARKGNLSVGNLKKVAEFLEVPMEELIENESVEV